MKQGIVCAASRGLAPNRTGYKNAAGVSPGTAPVRHALGQQHQRLPATAAGARCDNFYAPALPLFGPGGDQRRCRFARERALSARRTCHSN